MLLLPPGVAPRSVSTLSVDVDDAPGVLLRVLGICQRRGARVVALTYHDTSLELALDAQPRALSLIRAKLEAAIDVRAVSVRQPLHQRPLLGPEPGGFPGGGVLSDPLGA
jgi:acetolactate synthase regulatory subunit